MLYAKSYDSIYYFKNTFSTRLFPFNLNFFSLFVPDLLHEFELGVWKAIFTHLLRILYAAGNDCIQSLNWRWVSIIYFNALLTKAS